MPRATFIIWPEDGHTGPALNLADAVARRGHETTFVGLSDFQAALQRRGHSYHVVGADQLPRGSIDHAIGVFKSADTYRRYVRVWETVDLSHLAGQVVIVDILMPFAAFAAHRAGAKVVLLSTSLPYTREPGLPPLTTALGPATSPLARARSDGAWAARLASRACMRLIGRARGAPDPLARLKAMAERSGFGRDAAGGAATVGYELPFPELVLCPIDFELPHAKPSRRHYVEPLVTQASDVPGEPMPLDPARPLLLAAFGTQTHRYSRSALLRIFAGVVGAARARPGWQFVIASGSVDPAIFDDSPPNVMVRRRIPQASLLKTARLFVGHGGLNSVKEAIWCGVPMVVIPMMNDQAGNGARIRHHGFGEVAHPRWSTERQITRLVLRCGEDPGMLSAARRMAARFAAVEQAAPGVELIDALLSNRTCYLD